MQETDLAIVDTCCERCGARLEAALSAVDGVIEVMVDWRTGNTSVRHGQACESDALIRAIRAASVGTPHAYEARVIATRDC